MQKSEPMSGGNTLPHLLQKNMPFYIIGLILIFVIKYFYSRAGAQQLLWLLAPTARWVSFLSGIPFEYVQDIGYANYGMKILIAPSCSGMQFMLITAAMLIFSFVHLSGRLFTGQPFLTGEGFSDMEQKPEDISMYKYNCPVRAAAPPLNRKLPEMIKGLAWICSSLLLSYFFTILVNGLRIITAIYLPLLFERLRLFGGFVTPDSLHTAIGTLVYFTALLTLYRLMGHLFYRSSKNSLLRRCLPPVFWYFFIVLGIPFLNRAYEQNGERFIEFAVLVSSCCAGILLLYCVSILLRKLCRTRR